MKIFKISQVAQNPTDVVQGKSPLPAEGNAVSTPAQQQKVAEEMAVINNAITSISKATAVMNDAITKIDDSKLADFLHRDKIVEAIKNGEMQKFDKTTITMVLENVQAIAQAITVFNGALKQLTQNATTANQMDAGRNEMVNAAIQSLQTGNLQAFNGNIESFKAQLSSQSGVQSVI